MRSKVINFSITILALMVFLLSCSSSSEPALKVVRSKNPITEISQSVNVSHSNLLPAVLGVLKNIGIEANEIDSANGRIKTSTVAMQEMLCSSESIPLDCLTHYVFEIKPITAIASSFSVKYFEECASYGFGNLECPESKAEKLMISIVDEIKSISGVR